MRSGSLAGGGVEEHNLTMLREATARVAAIIDHASGASLEKQVWGMEVRFEMPAR